MPDDDAVPVRVYVICERFVEPPGLGVVIAGETSGVVLSWRGDAKNEERVRVEVFNVG